MATRQPRDHDDFAAEPRSIDIRDYWLAVRRRWVTVLVVTVLGAVGGLAYVLHAGPAYRATADVLVTPVTQGPLSAAAQPNQLVNMNTEQAVAQSGPVMEQAASLMHRRPSELEAEVPSRLTVTVPALSDVLQMTWQAGTPRAAQQGANAFATAYLMYRHGELAGQLASLEGLFGNQVRSLEQQISQVSAQLNGLPVGSPKRQSLVLTLDGLNSRLNRANSQLASLPTYDDSGGRLIQASQPFAPSGLGNVVVLVLGVLLGLLIGLVLALVRDAFDDRVRDAVQLERWLGAATLAVLPRTARIRRSILGGGRYRVLSRPRRVITVTDPDGRAAQAIRALRATLTAMAARQDLRTILVAGADGSVSSSRFAAELGVALAESGRRVLLVAADMRGSSLAEIFDLPNMSGLSNLLAGGGDPEVITRQPKHVGGVALPDAITKRLALLPSGPRVAQPLSVLDSGTMVGLLKSQRDAYEYVVLDSPSATVAADVIALAALVDGLVVFAREAVTSGRVLEELRYRLDQVGAHVIGGVFIASGRVLGKRRRRLKHPAGSVPITSAERRPAGQADRRPRPVTADPLAERPAVAPEGSSSLAQWPS